MVITPKPSRSNELVSMLSLLEFITPLDAALLMERNLICFHSQLLKGTPWEGGLANDAGGTSGSNKKPLTDAKQTRARQLT